MKLAVALLFAMTLQAQDLRVTAQLLHGAAEAMFGKLPKTIAAAQVQVCSNAPAQVTVPLARLTQQVRLTNGATVLMGDAALAVVASAQGSSPLQTTLRVAAGVDAGVKGLVIVGAVQPNTSWGAAMTMADGLIQLSSAIIGGVATGHQLLSIGREMLPDPLNLPALGCANGYAIVEFPTAVKNKAAVPPIDFSMTLPKGQ